MELFKIEGTNVNEIIEKLGEALGVKLCIYPDGDTLHERHSPATDIEYYHRAIATELGVTPESLKRVFTKFADSPYLFAIAHIYLKAISKEMEKDYNKPVKPYDNVWCINPYRMSTYSVVFETLPFGTLPAIFRTEEDAKLALRIINSECAQTKK
jgi:hypothetical protein